MYSTVGFVCTTITIAFCVSLQLIGCASFPRGKPTELCFCTKELIPVCSTQGLQFPNECVLRCEALNDPSIELDCKRPCPCSPTKRTQLPIKFPPKDSVITTDASPTAVPILEQFSTEVLLASSTDLPSTDVPSNFTAQEN